MVLLLFKLNFQMMFQSLSILCSPAGNTIQLPSAFPPCPAASRYNAILNSLKPLIRFAICPNTVITRAFKFRCNSPCLHHNFLLNPLLTSLHDNKPVYRLQQQSIRRLAFVPPYSVFCSISFRCGGLSIERNQKPLAPEITLAATHHDRQKQVEVKRSSRVNPHEIRLFSGCPYYFTLPMNGNDNTLPKQFRKPTEKSRSFSVDMHHIISSKCTTKCCEKGGAYRRKSP